MGWGVARQYRAASALWDRRCWCSGFVSHPFRKERGKSGAPGTLRCAREILHGLASAQDGGWVGGWRASTRATRALWGPALLVESFVSHLSAKNAERMGHPVLYVVCARSFTDLRPLRMTVGLGGWRASTVQRVLGGDRRCLVESFVSHPFRKERGKSGAPGALRCAREILHGLASVQDDGWVWGVGAPVPCSACLVGAGFLVEGFVSHPFRKERGKSGAPGTLRCAREILRGLASVQDDGWVGGWRASTVLRVLCGDRRWWLRVSSPTFP